MEKIKEPWKRSLESPDSKNKIDELKLIKI
jgi:hypothetical protein